LPHSLDLRFQYEMFYAKKLSALLALTASLVSAVPSKPQYTDSNFVNQTTCNGKTYTYEELAGYGFVKSDFRDKYGDTLGGIGSSLAIVEGSWKKTKNGYTGVVYGLPDRGWYVPPYSP
jgi:hypothetical protein